MLQEAVSNSWYSVSVYDDGQLVASGRIVSDGVVQCLICEMIVLPGYQNRGLGTAVMENLLNHCRAKGIRWVQLSAARNKQGFYERFGFTARPASAPGMGLFL
ncbi:Acetyltransferase (GNAT) family protein [compost metagenome]